MHAAPEYIRQIQTKDKSNNACSEDKCSHVQVIICSCNNHLNPQDIHITKPLSQTPLTITPTSLPSLQDLLNAFLSSCASSSPLSQQTSANLQHLSRAGRQLHALNLPARATKYVRNPLRLFGLANRTRIHAQRLLSFRLLFNIAVVVIWLLIRKFFELFGIDLPPLSFAAAAEPQNQRPAPSSVAPSLKISETLLSPAPSSKIPRRVPSSVSISSRISEPVLSPSLDGADFSWVPNE